MHLKGGSTGSFQGGYFPSFITWLHLRPYLKASPVFNVLETCRVYLLTIGVGIVTCIKKFIEWFFE